MPHQLKKPQQQIHICSVLYCKGSALSLALIKQPSCSFFFQSRNGCLFCQEHQCEEVDPDSLQPTIQTGSRARNQWQCHGPVHCGQTAERSPRSIHWRCVTSRGFVSCKHTYEISLMKHKRWGGGRLLCTSKEQKATASKSPEQHSKFMDLFHLYALWYRMQMPENPWIQTSLHV